MNISGTQQRGSNIDISCNDDDAGMNQSQMNVSILDPYMMQMIRTTTRCNVEFCVVAKTRLLLQNVI